MAAENRYDLLKLFQADRAGAVADLYPVLSVEPQAQQSYVQSSGSYPARAQAPSSSANPKPNTSTKAEGIDTAKDAARNVAQLSTVPNAPQQEEQLPLSNSPAEGRANPKDDKPRPAANALSRLIQDQLDEEIAQFHTKEDLTPRVPKSTTNPSSDLLQPLVANPPADHALTQLLPTAEEESEPEAEQSAQDKLQALLQFQQQQNATPPQEPAPEQAAPSKVARQLAAAQDLVATAQLIKGLAQAGALVKVWAPDGTLVAQTTVDAQGKFAAPLQPAVRNGTALKVQVLASEALQADREVDWQASEFSSVPVWTEPPRSPVLDTSDGKTLTGKAAPGLSVAFWLVLDDANPGSNTETLRYLGKTTTQLADGSFRFTPAEALPHNSKVIAKTWDVAENASPPSTVQIDAQPPTWSITTDAEVIARGAVHYVIAWSEPVMDFNASSLQVFGGTLSAFEQVDDRHWRFVITPPEQAMGLMGFRLAADAVHDRVGNGSQTPTEYSMAFDTDAPDKPQVKLAFDSGKSSTDNITADTTRLLVDAAQDSTISYAINGRDFGQWQAPREDGVYTVVVRSTDQAGNSSTSDALVFTRDTHIEAPVLTLRNDTGVNAHDGLTSDSRLQITTYEPGVSLSYQINGGVFGDYDGSAQGVYTVVVQSVDIAGNTSFSAPLVFEHDSLAPTMASQPVLTVEEGTEHDTVIWDADARDAGNSADWGIQYRLEGADSAAFSLDKDSGKLRFLQTPDFEKPIDSNRDNRYEVTLVATDRAGNSAKSALEIVIADKVKGDEPLGALTAVESQPDQPPAFEAEQGFVGQLILPIHYQDK